MNGETFPEEARKLFERIRVAAGESDGESPLIDRVSDNPKSVCQMVKFSLGLDYDRVDYNDPIPISKQVLLFSYYDVREFNQPAYKRTYISEKFDLHTNGWVDWVVKRVEELGM